MTIKECTHQICREIGMTEEEIQAFFEFSDANSRQDAITGVTQHTVEELSEGMQEKFWAGMRQFVPVFVQRFREATGDQHSVTE
jgi:hypothetical protein